MFIPVEYTVFLAFRTSYRYIYSWQKIAIVIIIVRGGMFNVKVASKMCILKRQFWCLNTLNLPVHFSSFLSFQRILLSCDLKY